MRGVLCAMSADGGALETFVARYAAARTLQELTPARATYAAGRLAAIRLTGRRSDWRSQETTRRNFSPADFRWPWRRAISQRKSTRARTINGGRNCLTAVRRSTPSRQAMWCSHSPRSNLPTGRCAALMPLWRPSPRRSRRHCKVGDAHIFVTLPEPLADEISDNGAAYAWRRAVTAWTARGTRVAARDTHRYRATDPRRRRAELVRRPLLRHRQAAVPSRSHAGRTRRSGRMRSSAPSRRAASLWSSTSTTLYGVVASATTAMTASISTPAGKGRHFLRLQAFLEGLRAKGVVLAIASKNDPAAVQRSVRQAPRDDAAS